MLVGYGLWLWEHDVTAEHEAGASYKLGAGQS